MANPKTIILLRERLLAAGWNPVDVLLVEHAAIIAMSAAAALLMLYVPDMMDWWRPWRRRA